jgi:tetratricopeptide (TPR) repeat protein
MTSGIDKLISNLESRAQNDDPIALAEATKLVAENPSEPKVWSLRVYIFARTGNLSNAISDLTRAIELSSPEPSHYFDRGRYKLKVGDGAGAMEDFGRGIALCDEHGDDYYRESLHFMRADALLRAGKRREALADLQHVREGFTLWTTELRSKEALMSECG